MGGGFVGLVQGPVGSPWGCWGFLALGGGGGLGWAWGRLGGDLGLLRRHLGGEGRGLERNGRGF